MSLTGCMVGGLGGDGGVILLLVLSELDGFPVSLLPESTVSASDWAGSSLGSAESPPLPDVALELPGLPPGATLTETLGETVLVAVALCHRSMKKIPF